MQARRKGGRWRGFSPGASNRLGPVLISMPQWSPGFQTMCVDHFVAQSIYNQQRQHRKGMGGWGAATWLDASSCSSIDVCAFEAWMQMSSHFSAVLCWTKMSASST